MPDTSSANKAMYVCNATLTHSNPTSFTFTFVLEILTNSQIEDSNPGLLNNSETGFSAKFFALNTSAGFEICQRTYVYLGPHLLLH